MIWYKYIFIFCLHNYGKNLYVLAERKWNLNGKPGDGYYIKIEIGDPQQQFNVIIDTGSSNLAIAGRDFPEEKSYYNYNKSQTFVRNGTAVKVEYTEGWWEGFVGQDQVSIPSLPNFSPVLSYISIITNAHGFFVNESHYQGILGLAFPKIAKPYGLVVSWFDSLAEKFPLESQNTFFIELCGPSGINRSEHLGQFGIGDSDSNCLESEYSTPIHHRWFYEVIITKLEVGDDVIEISCGEFNNPMTIIDSGTSNLQLSSTYYDAVISQLKKGTDLTLSSEFWIGHEEYCFEEGNEDWSAFPSFTIYLSHDNFTEFGLLLTAQSYLRPALNISKSGCWRLGIEEADIGTVLGNVVMEGFCIIFDRSNDRIFFSKSSCENSSVQLLSIRNRTDLGACFTVQQGANFPIIVISIILAFILLPLVVALVKYIWTTVKPKFNSPVSFSTLDEQST